MSSIKKGALSSSFCFVKLSWYVHLHGGNCGWCKLLQNDLCRGCDIGKLDIFQGCIMDGYVVNYTLICRWWNNFDSSEEKGTQGLSTSKRMEMAYPT